MLCFNLIPIVKDDEMFVSIRYDCFTVASFELTMFRIFQAVILYLGCVLEAKPLRNGRTLGVNANFSCFF